MVIYADILFLVNLISDYFLIMGTAKFLHIKVRRIRIMLSALFGGAYSEIILLNLNSYILFLTKIAAMIVMTAIAFKFASFRVFLKINAAFFVVNFIFGGCVTALYLLTDSSVIYADIAGVYFNISPVVLIVFIVVSYLVIVLVNKFTMFRKRNSDSYLVKISLNGREYSLTGFTDSGNMLKEPFSGYPVVFVKRDIFSKGDIPDLKRAIVCNTVGGTHIVYGFRPANMVVKSKNLFLQTDKVYICENENVLNNSNLEIILNPMIFENEECATSAN